MSVTKSILVICCLTAVLQSVYAAEGFETPLLRVTNERHGSFRLVRLEEAGTVTGYRLEGRFSGRDGKETVSIDHLVPYRREDTTYVEDLISAGIGPRQSLLLVARDETRKAAGGTISDAIRHHYLVAYRFDGGGRLSEDTLRFLPAFRSGDVLVLRADLVRYHNPVREKDFLWIRKDQLYAEVARPDIDVVEHDDAYLERELALSPEEIQAIKPELEWLIPRATTSSEGADREPAETGLVEVPLSPPAAALLACLGGDHKREHEALVALVDEMNEPANADEARLLLYAITRRGAQDVESPLQVKRVLEQYDACKRQLGKRIRVPRRELPGGYANWQCVLGEDLGSLDAWFWQYGVLIELESAIRNLPAGEERERLQAGLRTRARVLLDRWDGNDFLEELRKLAGQSERE